MKDFKGELGLVEYLGPVTGKEFQDKYNEMSNSEDKQPIASTILPVLDKEGSTKIFDCWIFYKMKDTGQTKLTEEPKKLKMEL